MKRQVTLFDAALIFTVIGLLLYGVFILADYSSNLQRKVIAIDQVCIVTEVEFHQMGSISVAQLDPEWKVKTTCGYTYTLRRPVNPGDTIRVRILKYNN